MRVMVASGDRHIATAGSARCFSEIASAVQSPAMMESMVRKPVTKRGGSSMIGKRPPSGSQSSHIAKASCSSSPRKKRGIEIAASDRTREV